MSAVDSGTLRSNLDPFGLHDDPRLWDALRRLNLVDDTKGMSSMVKVEERGIDGSEDQSRTGSTTPTAPRLTLDSPIEVEGSNLSICRRHLVSLARALVKDSKILILEEATAFVDFETDRKIQDTITTAFQDRTILCITRTSLAYFFRGDKFLTAGSSIDRLRTIISYDRICVMDNGKIAEFDAPDALYAQNGIFRAMCEQSSITLEVICCARIVRAFQVELENSF